MKKYLNNIKAEASHIRMSTAEKASMRAAIFGAASPVHVQKSPYVFLSFFSSHEVRMVMAGLLAFVLVGSGTASAAQGALPGDLLYPIKLSITEKVEAVLAPTVADKATFEMKLAERRIEEAQALAAEGRLDSGVAAELALNFDQHAEKAEKLASEVEASEPGTAEQIKTRLSSSLAVNGAVLQKIGRSSQNKITKEESLTLGTRVIARAEGPARVAATARTFAAPAAKSQSADSMSLAANETSNKGPEETQRSAANLQKKAAEELSTAKELFAVMASQLDATTTAQIKEQFAVADEGMSRGSTLLSVAFGEAQAHFAQVLRTSIKLQALLKAEQRFNNGILQGLINVSSGEGGPAGEGDGHN
jgi:hypothetical protein